MAKSVDEIVSEISLERNTRIEFKSQVSEANYSNVVYELRTSNNEQWCLRVPVDADAGRYADRGMRILSIAKEKCPMLQAPAVLFSSEQYALLEFLPGFPLRSWNKSFPEKDQRRVLLDHLANFFYSLWKIELHVPKDSEQPISYSEWLQNEVDRGLSRTLQGTSSWGTSIHYLQRRMKIDDMVSTLPQDTGFVAIKHGDLNAWNVIITENGLSGIIDWDTSRIVPAAAAIQHPLFIADIPGWLNDDVPEGTTFEEDRAYLERAIRKLEGDHAGPISMLLETSRERQFLELSLHNSRINNEYVDQRLQPLDHSQKDALLNQLEDFLSLHASMRNLPNVLKVRAQLRGEDDNQAET